MRKKLKKRNPVAKAVRSLTPRIVPSKKKTYKRVRLKLAKPDAEDE